MINNIDLEHSGVLGMKWGRKKAQSIRVSTPTNQHVSTAGKKISKKGKPEPYKRPPDMAPKRLTDAQLKSRINRIEMEKKYATLTAKQVSPAKKMVMDILSTAIKTTATAYVTKMMGKGMDNFMNQAPRQPNAPRPTPPPPPPSTPASS